MAERKHQSQKQSAGNKGRSARSGLVRAKTAEAGAWKAKALDRYLTVRPGDTDGGDAARVIR
jgi:hypothetical protein